MVVPMPTLPLFKILKRDKSFELATRKAFVASVDVPVTANLANGEIVPIPTRPSLVSLITSLPKEESVLFVLNLI